MEQVLNKQNKLWWLNILLGIVLLGFGMWFWFTPLESYITLAVLFSTWMFVTGIFEIINALTLKGHSSQWGVYLIGGIVDVMIGGMLVMHENITIEILPLFLGFWLLFRAILFLVFYFDRKRGTKRNSIVLLLSAVLSGIFAVVILSHPVVGEEFIVYATAFAFLFMGVFRLILGLQQRKNYN